MTKRGLVIYIFWAIVLTIVMQEYPGIGDSVIDFANVIVKWIFNLI